jgi:hypothetical protein
MTQAAATRTPQLAAKPPARSGNASSRPSHIRSSPPPSSPSTRVRARVRCGGGAAADLGGPLSCLYR